MEVQFMSPAATQIDFKITPAPRLSDLNGKTIGLYNNMTGGADIAVNRIAELLASRYAGLRFVSYGGSQNNGRSALSRQVHIDETEAAFIATEVDAVIGATAH